MIPHVMRPRDRSGGVQITRVVVFLGRPTASRSFRQGLALRAVENEPSRLGLTMREFKARWERGERGRLSLWQDLRAVFQEQE